MSTIDYEFPKKYFVTIAARYGTLHVDVLSTTTPFRCVTVTTFHIHSLQPLSGDNLEDLRRAGIIGYGQSYRLIRSTTEAVDAVRETRDRKTGEVVPDVPPRNWEGRLHETDVAPLTYYVYDIESTCDSGD